MAGFPGRCLQSGQSAFLPIHDIPDGRSFANIRSRGDERMSEVGKRITTAECRLVGRRANRLRTPAGVALCLHTKRTSKHLSGVDDTKLGDLSRDPPSGRDEHVKKFPCRFERGSFCKYLQMTFQAAARLSKREITASTAKVVIFDLFRVCFRRNG